MGGKQNPNALEVHTYHRASRRKPGQSHLPSVVDIYLRTLNIVPRSGKGALGHRGIA